MKPTQLNETINLNPSKIKFSALYSDKVIGMFDSQLMYETDGISVSESIHVLARVCV